ncbi:TolC family outer membrane protein [Candidatus Nitrosacidococcus sp. I8]|uniref:TolC family outer membrane protein n=1 Tax=Candidatus Nitrosacidococcus sp. I8 TaxID=2942908 RepID=UPI0022276FF9|nr:TolC family outer membrane protein [Candidatus Nitrosacidococcus sp. I8]
MPVIIYQFFLGLLFSFFLLLPAQGTDLLEAYQLARQTNPDLQNQVAALQAALEAKPQAKALFFPTIGLSSNYNWTNQDISLVSKNIVPGFRGNFDSFGYTLNLSQPIYHRDSFIQLKQADATIAQAEANLVNQEQILLVQVAQFYFGILGAQSDLEFATMNKKSIGEQLEQAKERFKVGLATIVDANAAEAAYDLAVFQEIDAQKTLAVAKEQLRQVVGQYIPELNGLQKETPLIYPDPIDIDKWSATALQQNPLIDASEAAVANARQGIELQKSGHYPTLDIVGSDGSIITGGGRFGGFSTRQDVIGLQFNLPIFQGGMVMSKTRQSQHQLEQAMQQLESTRRQVYLQTRQAYLDVTSQISQVKALKQAIISNQSSLESTEEGYKVGTQTAVDLLVIRSNLYSALRDYAKARYDYLVNTLVLKQGAGIVTLEDLTMMNSWLH